MALFTQIPGVTLELEPNDNDSNALNRILDSSHTKAEDNEMLQLIYDTVRGRWIMMKWHSK